MNKIPAAREQFLETVKRLKAQNESQPSQQPFLAKRSNIFLLINLAIIIIIFFRTAPGNLGTDLRSTGSLAKKNNQGTISFIAQVCAEAETSDKSQRLIVCGQGAESGKVLITTKLYPSYQYGDYLKITGQLQSPSPLEDFDYESYLAKDDVYSVLAFPKIEKLPIKQLSFRQSAYLQLLTVKQALARIINRYLPEPSAGLAQAILLGKRRALNWEVVEVFSQVGLSHLLAISGTHITILSALLINFLLFLGLKRRRALGLAIVFLAVYPILTGLSASAVRAAIMGGLTFLGIYHYRLSSTVKVLAVTASLMLIIKPRLLRLDLGFQLSYAALLGIIYIYPLLNQIILKLVNRVNKKESKVLRLALETINLSLAAQLAILPILLVNFQELAIIAPLANVAVLWIFPLVMTSLMAAIGLSSLIPSAGLYFFTLPYLGLRYIIISATWLATWPGAKLAITKFTWTQGTVYYLGLILIIWRARVVLKKSTSTEIDF
jgi:competence protein ComEC